MNKVRKYVFDTEFAADGTVLRDPARGEFRSFDAAEVEAERARAYEAGKADALAEAERASAAALGQLAQDGHALLARLDALAQSLRGQAAEVALAAARKIAGEALAQFGEARARAGAEAAMEALPNAPRLIVRVAPAAEAALRPRLEAAAAKHMFEGALIVRAEESAASGDVELDWGEGVIAIERAEIEARVAALVQAALDAPGDKKDA